MANRPSQACFLLQANNHILAKGLKHSLTSYPLRVIPHPDVGLHHQPDFRGILRIASHLV